MKKIGIVAGSGDIPLHLIKNLLQEQISPFVVCLSYGTALFCMLNSIPHIKCGLGEIGKAIEFFKMNEAKELIIIGKVLRPNFSLLKPDSESRNIIDLILKKNGGDNNVLTTIVNYIENNHNLKVISANNYLQDLFLNQNINYIDNEKIDTDISKGIDFLKTASKFDIGQGVIVRESQIISVEGIEGTNSMLKRTIEFNKGQTYGGVFVKMPKVNQDLRLDLPTIGLKTLKLAKQANVKVIAIEKNKCFFLDQIKAHQFLIENNMSVVVFE